MGLLDQLFGGEMSTAVRFIIAFGVVLALIALTFVGLRRFAGRRLPISNGGRARQPRLGVLDAFAIDARRRLVLIRRDNVEHLIMIGGPNDLLIESEIVRAPAQSGLAPQRGQRAPTEGARAAVVQPQAPQATRAPPAPEPPAPAARVPAPETPGRPAAFRALARSASPTPPVASEAAPPPATPAKPAARAPQAEIMKEASAPTPPAAAPQPPIPSPKPKPQVDPLFADIERKLGEALAPRSPAPSAPPAKPAAAPPASPPLSARPAPDPAQQAPATKDETRKSHLDALEEEMASLLGRDRP